MVNYKERQTIGRSYNNQGSFALGRTGEIRSAGSESLN